MNEKITAFADRRKHTKTENIRLAIIGLVIVFIVGMCLPFAAASFKLSVVDTQNDNAETVIFEPDNDIINLSLGDFVVHKPMKDYAIAGREIGDIEILGINVYGLATTPFPTFDRLEKAESFTDSGALDFLVSDQFVDFSSERLGKAGDDVVEIGATIHELNGKANKKLKKMNETLSELNSASENLRESVGKIEDALNLVDNIVTLFIALLITAVVLTFFERIPKKIPAIALTVFSGIFIIIGIGVAVVNGMINDAIADSMTQIADTLRALIDGAAPGLYNVILRFTGGNSSELLLRAGIGCGAGWWLMTISLVAMTVLAYMRIPQKTK